MKLGVIAVGQAGGKITDKLLERQAQTGGSSIKDAVAVNTAKADLTGLEYIPKENRILVGQSQVKGHGVGADNELGAEVMEADIQQVQNAIDKLSTTEIDAFFIVAALGGGTGSGGAPVIARHIQKIYTEPVYGLGILPSTEEGGIYNLNAARSLQTFVDQVDNLIVFDNDSWRQTGDSVEQGYDRLNSELVKRLDILLNAGEINEGEDVAESVVDSSEIINTLNSGGISTIGYATNQVERKNSGGLLSRFTSSSDESQFDDGDTVNLISSLIRKAALGRLTFPAELDGIERSLVVVAGPPEHLNRKGIERARKWVEEQTGSMEVRGGDYPVDSDTIAGVVLLSGVHNSDRIKELQAIAVEAQDNIEEIQSESDENLENLVKDDDGELDSLF